MNEEKNRLTIQYRPVREAEMPLTVDLFLATVKDLARRWNLDWSAPPRSYVETYYEHVRRTGIFEVAEVDGRIAAICHAVVRDHLWFLSGFWTLPSYQGQKIGRPLLRRVWEEGASAGASLFFTWSSIDLQAMATYMKMGMMPGYQLLNFAGAPGDLPETGGGYAAQPLELQTAVEIDLRIRGTGRAIDHRFWLTEMRAEGRQLLRDGRIVGYYYINNGTVGPAAWLEDEDGQALLAEATREASTGSEQVRLIIPGVNHLAIRFALRTNLKLIGYGHLLGTGIFGKMERYLSSGPSLF